MLPLALGTAPFGIAIGATAAASSMDVGPSLAAALLMFGGSAQLALVQLLNDGAAIVVAVVVASTINLRFVAYSLALAPLFARTPRRGRVLMASTLVDQTYLLTTVEAQHDRDEAALLRFYLAASSTIGVVWVASQVFGLVVGTAVPAGANVAAASPISLAGLAARATSSRPSQSALVAAIAAQCVLAPVAGHLTLVLAVLAGVAIAQPGGSGKEARR